jgi:hypothetical protein
MKKEKRFEVLLKESLGIGRAVTILRDTKTGVHYLYNAEGYAGGITPLLDKDGKPIVDNRKKEDLFY